ncbi:Hsp20/alpha crystallin family protein [Methanopyrus sp.]
MGVIEDMMKVGMKGAKAGFEATEELIKLFREDGRLVGSILKEMEPEEVTELLEGASSQLIRMVRSIHTPAVDVFERSGEFVIVAEVPGARPEDVQVRAGERFVEIAAKIPKMREGEAKTRERVTGEVRRRIDLPEKIDPNAVNAKCGRGLLIVRAPKAEVSEVEVKPMKEE